MPLPWPSELKPLYMSRIEVLKKSKQIEDTRESVPVDKSEQGKKWQDILEKTQSRGFWKIQDVNPFRNIKPCYT